MSTPSSFSLFYCRNVLYFREGWNYLLELYFWILIGALLLVSLTIYFARPSQSNTNKYNYNNLEGQIGQMPGANASKSENTDVIKSDKQSLFLESQLHRVAFGGSLQTKFTTLDKLEPVTVVLTSPTTLKTKEGGESKLKVL